MIDVVREYNPDFLNFGSGNELFDLIPYDRKRRSAKKEALKDFTVEQRLMRIETKGRLFSGKKEEFNGIWWCDDKAEKPVPKKKKKVAPKAKKIKKEKNDYGGNNPVLTFIEPVSAADYYRVQELSVGIVFEVSSAMIVIGKELKIKEIRLIPLTGNVIFWGENLFLDGETASDDQYILGKKTLIKSNKYLDNIYIHALKGSLSVLMSEEPEVIPPPAPTQFSSYKGNMSSESEVKSWGRLATVKDLLDIVDVVGNFGISRRSWNILNNLDKDALLYLIDKESLREFHIFGDYYISEILDCISDCFPDGYLNSYIR